MRLNALRRHRRRYDAGMNRRLLPALLVAFLALLLVACGGGGTKSKTDAMSEYGAAVRWNDFDAAWLFVSPEIRAARPLTDLERSRFKQIQVTGYQELGRRMAPDGVQFDQDVEIHVVNRNTQVERAFTDHQHWTYDPEAKLWWLVSGLPDFNTSSN